MNQVFQPKGICPKQITYEIKDGKVYNVQFLGGCQGNLKAISKLLEGQEIAHIIDILDGTTCGNKGTSCADQLSKALQGLE